MARIHKDMKNFNLNMKRVRYQIIQIYNFTNCKISNYTLKTEKNVAKILL